MSLKFSFKDVQRIHIPQWNFDKCSISKKGYGCIWTTGESPILHLDTSQV